MPGIAKESVVLEDGAQTIPIELICGQCQNVLLQPVANTCPHIFCFGCVRKKLASGPAARKCPICDAEWDSEPRDLPEQIKAQLNSLKYHCPLKCGGHLYAKEKETHVKKYCANTILLCPNSSKGCRFKIERKNVEDHLQNCHYREVSCEACGHRCLFVNLFSHQLLKRCARDLLQKQYVQSLRKNHKALVDYSKEMKIDRIQTAQVNRNAEVRYKGLTPLRYRRLYSSYGTPSPRHGSIYNDLMSRPTSAYSLSRASRNDDYMRSCRRCTLDFKPSKNHDKACRYHREPFLDLFEDDCGACGDNKLDGSPCLRGFHIPLYPSEFRPSSARTSGVKLGNGGDFNSPASLTDIKPSSSRNSTRVRSARPSTARVS